VGLGIGGPTLAEGGRSPAIYEYLGTVMLNFNRRTYWQDKTEGLGLGKGAKRVTAGPPNSRILQKRKRKKTPRELK